jgi:hypothetical protein
VIGQSTALPWDFRPKVRQEGKIKVTDQSEKIITQLNNKAAKNLQAYTIFVK